WGWVLGAVGALLAVPLSLLVKAMLVDVDEDSSWLRPLLAGGAAGLGPDHPDDEDHEDAAGSPPADSGSRQPPSGSSPAPPTEQR
ncbi:MAG: AI-2E family transporter, partial [Actinomycetota bacterium]|nr:AI-2E family transporter [Actinomycetota bacterium]